MVGFETTHASFGPGVQSKPSQVVRTIGLSLAGPQAEDAEREDAGDLVEALDCANTVKVGPIFHLLSILAWLRRARDSIIVSESEGSSRNKEKQQNQSLSEVPRKQRGCCETPRN